MPNQNDLNEQIRRQKEEIESLRRKNQSLEDALQKCLDPDSGELALRQPGAGEAALLEKIAVLEREQSDHADSVWLRPDMAPSKDVERFASSAAMGLFMHWTEYNSLAHKYEPQSRSSVWARLPAVLIDRPEFDDYWTERPFRRAMGLVNFITERLQYAEHQNFQGQITTYEEISDFLTASVDAGEHQGTIQLAEAVKKLYQVKEKERMDLRDSELDILSFSLQIIIQVQRLTLRARASAPEKS